MESKPFSRSKPGATGVVDFWGTSSDLTMQITKSLVSIWAAALVVLPMCVPAAETDTEAQIKAREALRERERDWGKSTPPAQGVGSAPVAETASPAMAVPVTGTETEAQRRAREALREKLGQPPAQPEAGNTNPPAAEQVTDFRKVPRIRGIVIVRSLKEFNPDGVPLNPGLTVTNNSLLAKPQFVRIANSFLGQSMDEAKMRELQREIILYYRQHDRPLVDVLYPEQDVNNGMLQIIVIEGRLKEVRVQDKQGNPYTNGWSGAKFVHDSIHLRSNDVIEESRINKDVDWLNRNPFRTVEAVFEPDKREYGSTSLLLRVDEQRQWSADFGYEDSGSVITSENRLIAGFTWGKAFGLEDNQFRYSFTCDPSLDLLRVHSGSYYLPLPWRHAIRLSGYYLNVTGDLGGGSTLSGTAYQASLRYEVPLPAIGKLQQEASVGLDFKNSDNNLFFNEVSYVNTPTEIFQVAGGYTAALQDHWGRTSISIQGYWSPGGITTLNSDTAFQTASPFAKANYTYGRFTAQRITRLPGDFSWIVRGVAQIANGNLLPSEQLGVGGYNTVRGYEEREGNGDEGYLISNELRTPAVSLVHLFTQKFALDDQLQLLGFWDYGEEGNVTLLSGEQSHYSFSSVGPGLRYTISRHFSLRFDYGWQLLNSGLGPAGQHSRSHIGVVATY